MQDLEPKPFSINGRERPGRPRPGWRLVTSALMSEARQAVHHEPGKAVSPKIDSRVPKPGNLRATVIRNNEKTLSQN